MSSTKPTRREEAAQDKVARILAAATALFAERGFHGTAVPEVAKQAGVGAGTIYRYFENKEDLVNAVFRHAKQKLKLYLSEDVDFDGDMRELFHRFWLNLVRFAEENPIEFHFLELQDHAPYLDEESRNIELEVLAPIWLMGVQARQRGVVKDMPAEALMAMVWGAFVGLMKAQVLGYITVSKEVLGQAEENCWQMIAR
ncbi:MAG: TetR family transcriptional regulator [Pseudomonadales bacterium]|nr:TetR family transcriptional regulator [Pseudomonadales bacterium]